MNLRDNERKIINIKGKGVGNFPNILERGFNAILRTVCGYSYVELGFSALYLPRFAKLADKSSENVEN